VRIKVGRSVGLSAMSETPPAPLNTLGLDFEQTKSQDTDVQPKEHPKKNSKTPYVNPERVKTGGIHVCICCLNELIYVSH
jgi:hypothetical protein